MQALSTLEDGGNLLANVTTRRSADGKLVARVLPADIYEWLLLHGVTAEAWMQDSVTDQNLRQTMAGFYRLRTCVMMRCYLIWALPVPWSPLISAIGAFIDHGNDHPCRSAGPRTPIRSSPASSAPRLIQTHLHTTSMPAHAISRILASDPHKNHAQQN